MRTDLVQELLETLKSMTFVVESVAHLQGKERELLPMTDAARNLIDRVEGTKYHFDINVQAGNYTVQIDTHNKHGYFEHNELGDESAGELSFEGGELTDYDGVFALPKAVVTCLRQLGYRVDESCEED